MTDTEFLEIVKDELTTVLSMIESKGEEYSATGDLSTADRLGHFKKSAVIMNNTPKAALWAMLSKHLISLSDMCTNGAVYTKERWTEKITDSINYLLLLKALVIEEEQKNA